MYENDILLVLEKRSYEAFSIIEILGGLINGKRKLTQFSRYV